MQPKNKDASPKRRYLSSEARKEEILEAALIEFSDRTYNAVSMEQIAERAGLSKAGIYAHFKRKDEIFHALLERTTRQLYDFEGWLPDEDLSLSDFIDVYLERLYATFDSPGTISIYRLILAESDRATEVVQFWHDKIVRQLQERSQSVIQHYIHRGVVRPSVLTDHFFPLALAPALLWMNSSMLSQGTPSISLKDVKETHRQLLFELLHPR
ncbi:TetR/AcrR family transcriptional regulator [uncultured Marinobacter sp.]|uniref:TetR/AcrR family transcriptional regulator n=1 Tax=uncultured Marinobacter sp. TaxID=187379 RepID=UPI002585BC42|nr:TetR/AcrR family transcriptional regulator [uncultured Marinobacter sp.]